MRWHYYVLELTGDQPTAEWGLQDVLDDMGSAGWELVGIYETLTGANRFRHAAVFKRPVES